MRTPEEPGAGAPRPHRCSPRSNQHPPKQPESSMDPPGGSRMTEVPAFELANRRNLRCSNWLWETGFPGWGNELQPTLATLHLVGKKKHSSLPKSLLQDPRKCCGSVPSKIFISPPHVWHIWQKNDKLYCLQDFHSLIILLSSPPHFLLFVCLTGQVYPGLLGWHFSFAVFA